MNLSDLGSKQYDRQAGQAEKLMTGHLADFSTSACLWQTFGRNDGVSVAVI